MNQEIDLTQVAAAHSGSIDAQALEGRRPGGAGAREPLARGAGATSAAGRHDRGGAGRPLTRPGGAATLRQVNAAGLPPRVDVPKRRCAAVPQSLRRPAAAPRSSSLAAPRGHHFPPAQQHRGGCKQRGRGGRKRRWAEQWPGPCIMGGTTTGALASGGGGMRRARGEVKGR